MAYVSLGERGHVGVIRLERPEALNAISGALADELADAAEEIATRDDVWVVVLGAAGDKAFCVGADLKERASFTLDDYHSNRKQMLRMFAALRALPQPSLASVFGFALGGGLELALSCDVMVASEDARMGLPEARVGLLPAGGGTQLLTRRLGTSRAKEIIFTGKRIDAHEASALGLVAEVVPRAGLEERTMEWARRMCEASPVSLREAKRCVEAAPGMPLGDGIALENESWARVVASDDRAEGVAAFNEKREPRWRNR
ncbi:MAG: enoyl-CoA hydratase/isomerase family protein [Actinomycetota bacterium]